MFMSRRIGVAYLPGINGSSGDWGITAGQIDYTAATKLGRTIGGIVTIW